MLSILAQERKDISMTPKRFIPQEDYELESRRMEALDNADRIRRDDEVLYGADKTGSDIDSFLDKHPLAEFRDDN